MEQINLNFEELYLENGLDKVLDVPGVFCVYSADIMHSVFDENGKVRVFPQKLLYIDQGTTIGKVVKGHFKKNLWQLSLLPKQELLFTAAKLEDENLRNIAKAALVFRHQPIHNHKLKKEYCLPTVKMELLGNIPKLKRNFVVKTNSKRIWKIKYHTF